MNKTSAVFYIIGIIFGAIGGIVSIIFAILALSGNLDPTTLEMTLEEVKSLGVVLLVDGFVSFAGSVLGIFGYRLMKIDSTRTVVHLLALIVAFFSVNVPLFVGALLALIQAERIKR